MRFRILVILVCFNTALFAQSVADSLIRLLPKEKSDTAQVNLLLRIAKKLDYQLDTAELGYAQQALALSQKIDYKHGIAAAYGALGLAEETRGNFVRAISHQKNSYERFLLLDDTIGQAKALGNMANNEYFIGDYTSAAEHAFQALKFYEILNNPDGILASNLAIGNVLVEQKSFDAALKHYMRVLKVGDEHPDKPHFKARALASIGNVYNAKNQYDSAAYFYLVADSVFEKMGAQYEISVCINNLGTIRQMQKRYVEAEQLFRRSLQIRRSVGDSDGVGTCFQNLASLSNARMKFDSAHYYYMRALDIATASNSRSQRLGIYEGLALTFSNLKKYDSAYYYLDRFKSLNDTVKGEESINAVNVLRERYDDEKHQHELELLESKHVAEEANASRNIVLLIMGIFALLTVISVIWYRSRVKQKLNGALEKQNAEITLQKKHITDSIDYAKKIQDSILPPEHLVHAILPNAFILYEPKDVVSGDFYWVERKDDIAIFSAVDCTGHGVPGALMSVIGFNLLTQAVNEKGITKPSDILHHLDFGVNKLLRQSDSGSIVKDGMDLAICTLDMKTNLMQFAGAFNPVYILHKGELKEIKADKFPIGVNTDGVVDEYTNHTIQLDKGDMIYLTSDGYADQFGGPLGKKFKYNRMRDLLRNISDLPLEEQKIKLRNEFLNWKGNHEQVDDILMIGVRV